ncbi:hypothetical protein BDV38DRAFT_248895 [Aspergillus pseudotamarii]|uniref:Uncharacterized protein n=1 Tax=Aspergillus pseudotamarii TaxID=132259 RepID=A0A5N6SSD7_ASPPS|nr:uncharacterized protein BDV38DRAFT_248895 [Aspergillus pseudotamarii]KAE8136680.1 hypothetical protein BDV38DRAFT_248895 [Aspergillus pseudotamarii]
MVLDYHSVFGDTTNTYLRFRLGATYIDYGLGIFFLVSWTYVCRPGLIFGLWG